METTYLKINPADNVAVAISPLKAGETIQVDGKDITLKTDIPAGHKVTLKDFNEGENIIKYGYPIGHAIKPVPQGSWISEKEIKTKKEAARRGGLFVFFHGFSAIYARHST